jgi:hypothetical protein
VVIRHGDKTGRFRTLLTRVVNLQSYVTNRGRIVGQPQAILKAEADFWSSIKGMNNLRAARHTLRIRPGARVEVDVRDRSWVAFVPNLVPAG